MCWTAKSKGNRIASEDVIDNTLNNVKKWG